RLPMKALVSSLLNEMNLIDQDYILAVDDIHLLQKPVEEKTSATVTEKTEGWVTGLRLAAISICHLDDATDMLYKLPGGFPYVMEYLFGEVFMQQSPETQRFLEHSAILDRFCAPLCDAICGDEAETGQGKHASVDFILQLKNEGLFVISLDEEDRWFRYHHFDISKIPSAIDAVEALLNEAPIEQHLRAEIDFFRGYIYYFQNEGSLSLKHLQDALEMVPDECHEIQSQTEILYGLASQM
ncbi:MAG: hypothetical protein ABIK07_04880, partial [Planctomycetota bacterium]